MAMASPNVVTVWVPLQRTPPEMGSLAFAPPPPAGHDAWTLRELPGCPMDEKSDEYDEFVASALEEKGVLPGASNGSVSAAEGRQLRSANGQARVGVADGDVYELGDISIHLTSVFVSALYVCGNCPAAAEL